MKRLRHPTHAAALRYQHTVDGRAAEVAERMSLLVEPEQDPDRRQAAVLRVAGEG